MRVIDVTEPEPGDRAHHRHRDLDSREVTRVERDPSTGVPLVVWLDILGIESGPYSSENYTYTRTLESVEG